jgi:hypothetical protein
MGRGRGPPKSSGKTIFILFVVLLLCLSSSAMGGMGWFVFLKPPDGNGRTLPGKSTKFLLTTDGGVWKGKDMAECRAHAKNLGYPAVGHRNETHTNDNLKNTCFFYNKIERNDFTGDEKDTVNTVACTDPTLDWKVCSRVGNAISGHSGKHLSPQTSAKHPGNSLEECRALATEWGHKGVGYRTIGHGNNDWKNTCFSYTDIEKSWTGNREDRGHVSACTDPKKTWPDC